MLSDSIFYKSMIIKMIVYEIGSKTEHINFINQVFWPSDDLSKVRFSFDDAMFWYKISLFEGGDACNCEFGERCVLVF